MKKYYNQKTKELNDKLIVSDLRKAADDYENGEIIEVRDTILDILISINNFTVDYHKGEMKDGKQT